MNRARRLWAPLAAALLAPAGAAAFQPQPTERDCQDDRGVDRCAPAEHRRMLDLFGLLPVEDHVEAGSQLRRVMYVDGYGRDVVAIVFIRPREADPVLRVHFPRREDGTRIDPLQAPVPPQVWEDILFRSQKFDRELSPPPPPPEGTIQICVHSWVYAVEAVEPAGAEERAEVRRKTEDACTDGLATEFAWEAQSIAITLLPHCNLLDPDLHRNPAMRLAACAMLTGDRQTAAIVHNSVTALRGIQGAGRIAQRFEDGATLEWHGESFSRRDAAEAWRVRTAEDPGTRWYLTGVHGETPDRARVEGVLHRRQGDEVAEAPVVLVWTRRSGDDFFIESARVGPFVTLPAHD